VKKEGAGTIPAKKLLELVDRKKYKLVGSRSVAVMVSWGEELASLQRQVDGWNVIEGHHITKTFTFPNFRGALTFVNRVGELAEEQGHHPDISLAWGKVEITTWTHKINGLTESDFILAAKIDQLYES
jgi:4a-hydroxytetrahydrobiopterin dehydratase